MLSISKSQAEKHLRDAVNSHFSVFSKSRAIDFSNFSVKAHNSNAASKGAAKGIRIASVFSTISEESFPTTVYFT